MHIGSRLKNMRLCKQLSQKAVSAGIVSTSHYSNIESGRFVPSDDVLLLLADRFSVPVSYLQRTYEEDGALRNLLTEWEYLIHTDSGKAEQFAQKHAKKFTHIPSMKQELQFSMLHFLHLSKSGQVKKAVALYESDLSFMHRETVKNSSMSLVKMHTYVSALYYYYTGDYERAITDFQEALPLHEDGVTKAKIHYNIALSLYQLYDYGSGLSFAKQALRLYMEEHRWPECADCYNLIAALYAELHKTEDALHCIAKGLDIAEEHAASAANLHHNRAFCKMEAGHHAEALDSINKSIALKQAGGYGQLFLSCNLKADILLSAGDLSAFQHTVKVLRDKAASKNERALMLYKEGRLYFAVKEYGLYEERMLACTALFKELEDYKSLKESSVHFAAYLAEQKKYKSAFNCQEDALLAYRKLTRESKGGEFT